MVFQIFRAAEPAPIETKASQTAPLVQFHGSGRAIWSGRDTGSLVRNGFAGNPVGFRCVKMIAEAASTVPLVLQDAERRYDVHPLLSLLRKPNDKSAI